MIAIKRVYEPSSPEDGTRILVDRLWPRGLSKAAAGIDLWLKEIAPSTALRQWFHHHSALWPMFQARYWDELDANPQALATLVQARHNGTVTLLYAAKDTQWNNAVALKAYLEQRTTAGPKTPAPAAT